MLRIVKKYVTTAFFRIQGKKRRDEKRRISKERLRKAFMEYFFPLAEGRKERFVAIGMDGSSGWTQNELTMIGTFEKGSFCLSGKNFNGKILISAQRNPEERFRQFAVQIFDKAVPSAIKPVGKAENPSESVYEETIWFGEPRKTFMLLFRQRFAVVACNIGDNFPLAGSKSEKVRMANQMIGMFMVTRITDEVP
jgi:hypothetical protein